MLSLDERADLLVRVAELHRNAAYREITTVLAGCSVEDLCSEPDLGYSLALAYYRSDEFERALKLHRLLMPHSRVRAVDRLYRKHLILEGVLRVESGQLGEAEASFHEAMAHATRANDYWVIADAMMNLGILAWIGCRWEKALASFERALTTYTVLGRTYSIAACHQNLGMTYREMAMLAESDSNFDEAYQLYAAAPSDRRYELSLVESERALLISRLGDGARAAAMVRRALARIAGSVPGKRRAEVLRALGIVLMNQENDVPEARDCLEDALRLSQAAGSSLLEAEVREELSILEESSGDADLAKHHAIEAVRIYRAIGADARAQRVYERTCAGAP